MQSFTMARAARYATAALGLISTATAQIPFGRGVVAESAEMTCGHCAFSAALYYVHPILGNRVDIQGLGPDLVGPPLGLFVRTGASAVAVREDGSLVVGEAVLANDSLDLHVVGLHGFFASSDRRLPLLTPTENARVTGLELLSTGDAIASVSGSTTPSQIFRVDLATGSSAVLHTTAPGEFIADIALDEGSGFLYFASASGSGTIWEMPIAGGTPTPLGSIPYVSALQRHPTRGLVVTAGSAVHTFDLASGATTQVYYSRIGLVHALFDLHSDLLWTGYSNISLFAGALETLWLGGAPHTLASTGALSDLALRPASRTYGVASPGARRFAWAIPAHFGVLPRIGEASFAVRVESTPPAIGSGLLGIAPLPAQIPAGGIVLLLDPLSMLLWSSVPPNGLVPLPIPPRPDLVGQRVYFQSFHFEAGLLGSSNGLSIAILD